MTKMLLLGKELLCMLDNNEYKKIHSQTNSSNINFKIRILIDTVYNLLL